MESEISRYKSIQNVNNVDFNGEITEQYEGSIHIDLDDSLSHIWLNNVSLDSVIRDLNEDYDISSIVATYPSGRSEMDEIKVIDENRQELEEIGHFSGFGMDIGGPVTYIEHPTQYTTGMPEKGPSHQHCKHYLESRVEADTSHSDELIEDSLSIASQALENIEEKEHERRSEIWQEWADDKNYHEKGRLRKWFMRRFKGPKDGNVYLNPTAVIYDLDKTGLSAEQLLDTSKEL